MEKYPCKKRTKWAIAYLVSIIFLPIIQGLWTLIFHRAWRNEENLYFLCVRNDNKYYLAAAKIFFNDVNKRNNYGISPVLLAAYSAKWSVAEHLIEIGGNPNIGDEIGLTACKEFNRVKPKGKYPNLKHDCT